MLNRPYETLRKVANESKSMPPKFSQAGEVPNYISPEEAQKNREDFALGLRKEHPPEKYQLFYIVDYQSPDGTLTIQDGAKFVSLTEQRGDAQCMSCGTYTSLTPLMLSVYYDPKERENFYYRSEQGDFNVYLFAICDVCKKYLEGEGYKVHDLLEDEGGVLEIDMDKSLPVMSLSEAIAKFLGASGEKIEERQQKALSRDDEERAVKTVILSSKGRGIIVEEEEVRAAFNAGIPNLVAFFQSVTYAQNKDSIKSGAPDWDEIMRSWVEEANSRSIDLSKNNFGRDISIPETESEEAGSPEGLGLKEVSPGGPPSTTQGKYVTWPDPH